MDQVIKIGPALRERRDELGWTQERLAEKAGISADLVGRLERGKRPGSLQTITKLARALDCDPGDLTGKSSRVEPVGDASVVAVRNAIFDPAALLPTSPGGVPAVPAELMRRVESGYGAYFSGEFGALASLLPGLLRECRDAQDVHGAQAAAPFAHAFDLAAALLVHTGRDDAALHGIERAVLTARGGDDEFRPVSFLGTYAWVLLHMGRYAEAEHLVVRAADEVAPRMSDRDIPRLAAWGGLMLHAAVIAATDHDRPHRDRSETAVEYLDAARAAAVRMGQDARRYWISFGPTQVAVQAAHIHTMLEQPDRAIAAARGVRSDALLSIQYGRHLLDVSRSLYLRRRTDEAIAVAERAHDISPEWFRHQRFAAALAQDLRKRKQRLPDALNKIVGAFHNN